MSFQNPAKYPKTSQKLVAPFGGLATPQISSAEVKLPPNDITRKPLIGKTWFLTQNLQNCHVSISAKKNSITKKVAIGKSIFSTYSQEKLVKTSVFLQISCVLEFR